MLSLIFALIGIFVGILLNRAADNLPPPFRRSFFETPRCPYCDTPRTPLEQFGIASFVLRRDKCHNCSAPLRLRAPLLELTTAAAFAYLAARYPLDLFLFAACLFTTILLLIAVIDIEHKLILNVVVLPATVLALLLSPILLAPAPPTLSTLNPRLILVSLLGAAIGYILTYGIYLLGILFVRFLNRNRANKINTVAFGMGDVKLAGMLGAMVGVPAILYVLIYAIIFGGIGAVAAIVYQMVRRSGYSAFMAIPYGPYLILAGWGFLIFRPFP